MIGWQEFTGSGRRDQAASRFGYPLGAKVEYFAACRRSAHSAEFAASGDVVMGDSRHTPSQKGWAIARRTVLANRSRVCSTSGAMTGKIRLDVVLSKRLCDDRNVPIPRKSDGPEASFSEH